MNAKCVTGIFVLLILFWNGANAQRRALFGQPCSRLTRCDSRGALACKNGYCECIIADAMVYNRRYGRCSVLPGEKCIFTAVSAEERAQERSWKEELPCVENATCQETFCTCFPGFYESLNDTCEPKRGHREDCDTSTACRDDQFLICNNTSKRCECNTTLSTYDFSRLLCVRRAGASCDDMQICVRNSYCQFSPIESGSICQCEGGYFANADGICERKREFGEACQDNSYCRAEEYVQLVCDTDGRCGCDTTVSVFDVSANMCRRRAGVSCDRFPYCVENSECGRSNNVRQEAYESDDEDYYAHVPRAPPPPNPNAKCECVAGYFQTVNGTCERKRPYGENCNIDINCQDDLKCNTVNGRCQCDLTKSIYDRAKRRCVGLANAQCQNSDDCITNSECRWGSGDEKNCLCSDGFAHSTNGSCLASFGAACSEHWTSACNTEQGLVCKEGKCSCKYEDFQTFDQSEQKCVSQTHGPCDESIPCVTNSHCTANNENGIYWCRCDKGFVEVDGQCQLTIGEECHNNASSDPQFAKKYPKCDTFASLFCIDGTCQCGALQVYDKQLAKCKGQVGSLCFVGNATEEGGNCIEGAECMRRRFHTPWVGICKCKPGLLTTKERRCIEGRRQNMVLLTEEQLLEAASN